MSVVPAGNRLAIVDPPADDAEPRLILPDGVGGPSVGVVVDVGRDCHVGCESGDVVYYECKAREVDGVKIIHGDCVIAYDDSSRAF